MNRPQAFQSLRTPPALWLILLSALLPLLLPCHARAQAERKQILFISSYHPGYKFSDDIARALNERFAELGNIDLRVEYLDTKRIASPEYFDEVARLYQIKYANANLDLIVSSDDAALNFLFNYGDALFPQVPVVFVGANYFDETRLQGFERFTGISEEADIRGTLDVALSIHPETNTIIVVDDTTVTGRRIRQILLELAAEYPQIQFEILDDVSMAQVQQRLSGLSSGTLVLLTIFSTDGLGTFYEYDQYTSSIAQSSSVPVYGTWDFSLGYGIVGGKLTSGYTEGQRAAALAERVLNGERPQDIPVQRQTQAQFMFDYAALTRWSIPLSRLPEGSFVLNRPVSFHEQNPTLVWGIGIGFTGLLGVIAALIFNNNRRRAAQRELAASNRELQRIQASLEQRVAERTRGLELAAQVGRAISQVRNLDDTLTDAAEIIRAQFDLYYVQVYLTDARQNNLILRAGTGEVGKQLLARKHHLPLDLASINGSAALRKHAIVVADTAIDSTFLPNPLLPQTRSEMAIPLLLGEQVVGVLDLQSSQPNALNRDNLPAFESLAGQLVIAIQNANLLEQTEQARAEVEAQARQMVRAGWQEYLDGIDQPQQMGFLFEQNTITRLPVADALLSQNQHTLSVPLTVAGATLGYLEVDLPQTEQNQHAAEIIQAVAGQIAQRLENLRLLQTAQRYRLQAEQAARRMTMEGWQEYAAQQSGALNYFYDRAQVTPVNQPAIPQEDALTVSLKLHEESVGLISILETPQATPEDIQLVQEVAARLGAHIENLRLFEQTQFALSQTERLSNASLRFAQSADAQELLRIAVETLAISEVNRALLETCNFDTTGQLQSMTVLANWWSGSGQQPSPIGATLQTAVMPALAMFVGTTPTFIEDAAVDTRLDPAMRVFLQQRNIRALAALPLEVGSQQIGVLFLECETPRRFSKDETRLFVAMGPQIATVLENRRNYERAQKQAEREALLNTISQKIQSATSVEAVLQIAAREIGHALGAPRTVAQLSVKDRKE